jgi:SSS family solute:Na+ symporter
MALSDIKSLWDEFIKVLGLFAGGLGGLFLLGVTTTRPSGAAAIIGLILSGIMQWLITTNSELHPLMYAATGIVSCFLFGYLASFILPANDKDLAGLTVLTSHDRKANLPSPQ